MKNQGSVLGPLLFLIYINDLPDGITSLSRIFADDASLFSKVDSINESVNDLNADLEKISQWAIDGNRNLNFNRINKKNIFFYPKSDPANVFHPTIKFNNSSIASFCMYWSKTLFG